MKSMIRPSFVQPEDLLDRLFKARLANKIEQLPEDEQRILARMEYADDLIRSGGRFMVTKNVIAELEIRFKEHNVTKRTLENDIARAKKFFLSNYKKEDKEYDRGVRIQWLDRIADAAFEDKDFKSAVAAVKEGNEILGLKKDDPNLPDYDKYQRQPILVLTDPAKINLKPIDNLQDELAKLRMSRSSFLNTDAEDIADAELDDQDDE